MIKIVGLAILLGNIFYGLPQMLHVQKQNIQQFILFMPK